MTAFVNSVSPAVLRHGTTTRTVCSLCQHHHSAAAARCQRWWPASSTSSLSVSSPWVMRHNATLAGRLSWSTSTYSSSSSLLQLSLSSSSLTPKLRQPTSPTTRSVAITTFRRAKTTTMIRGFPNNFKGSNRGTGGYDSGQMWEQLIDFPCVFTFKIIGMQQGDFANDIIDSVALALDMDRKFLKTSFRDRGKYRSITVEAPVNTVDQIRDVYAAIDRDPRVKFKF